MKAVIKKRVLVVDDEAAICRIVGIGLKVLGYDVISSVSGKEGLRLVESEKPDVMLLDIFMPGMDGFEVLRKLRATSNLAVIVFSAHHSSREEALRLGANDFIPKPFTPEQIARKITDVLESDALQSYSI